MIIVDTSGIIAAFNPREREHGECRAILMNNDDRFIVGPMVLAEVDYLAVKYLGCKAATRLLRDVVDLASVAVIDDVDTQQAIGLAELYSDTKIGLTDAYNVVLAQRYKTHDILSLDGHYRAIRPAGFDGFRMLPADLP